MRAAVFTDYGEPLDVREVEDPEPEPDGAVVAVEAWRRLPQRLARLAGRLGLARPRSRPGHILGHEPAGHVVAVGSEVDHVSEGDHVAIPFSLGDGTCPLCRKGHANICENRQALGLQPAAPGAFAEQVPVPTPTTTSSTSPTASRRSTWPAWAAGS